MSSKRNLRLDWCSHAAAKYAVEHWHYSRRMPKSKLAKVGVWEGGEFIGCVVFGSGACPQIAKPFGLRQTQVCELVRVALRRHMAPVSRIVSIAIRMVRKAFHGLGIIVSYADPEQGHNGGIYQAGNWVYLGVTSPEEWFEDCNTGERIHSHVYKRGRPGRATRDKAAGIIRSVKLTKHKYAMALNAEMREQLESLRQPYPKRATSIASDAPANQAGEGGATPTVALSSA